MEKNLQKKYRDSANRARRGLLQEQKQFGFISDGSGKRYRAGVYYVMAGEIQKAVDFYKWFEQEFSDDSGEPFFTLFGALAHYRAGQLREARRYLADTLIQNPYLLPKLFNEPLPKQAIWHTSNFTQPDYLEDMEEFLDVPTDEERAWIKQAYSSEAFSRLREAYFQTFGALLEEQDVEKREKILKKWYKFLDGNKID